MTSMRIESNAIPLLVELDAQDAARIANHEPLDWRKYKSQIEKQCFAVEGKSESSPFMRQRIKALREWLERK